ncbi:Abc transporter c family member 5, partial [Globisporangium splendens]
MSAQPLRSSPRTKNAYGALPSHANHNDDHDASNRLPSDASFVSRMLFAFVEPLMAKGNVRQLHASDMWPLEGENATATAFAKYNAQYEHHGKSIMVAICATYGAPLFLCGMGTAFTASCNLLAPAVLNYVINAFTAPVLDMHTLSIWLSAFFASRIVNAIVTAQTNFYVQMIAMRLTISLKSLLFQKAMRRSVQSKTVAKVADIANLFTSDIESILWAAFQINHVWILPIQTVIILLMLYYLIGYAVFAGLVVMAVSMVITYFVAKVEGRVLGDIFRNRDARMQVIKEAFNAIQIVKLNAWESKFAAKIGKVRAPEIAAMGHFMYLDALDIFILWASPIVVSTVSFAVYATAMDQVLTAAKVFTAIALFNALRSPLADLPSVLQTYLQAKVSLDRMAEYLNADEFEPDNVIREDPSQPLDVVVSNVNVEVKKGDLVVVHGTVGGGKSSFCSALLGEMEKISGSVFVRGRVAYYSQQTWIQNMTIRDNILFGNAFDPQRYQKVLEACGFLPDLAQFPGGDATEIGEKGINLSGGQRARLSLARACYSDADLFILDSPLAAVDAVVQSEIFSKCICGLLQNKTVILVTHSPDIIASGAANYKILVEDGELKGERIEISKPRGLYAQNPSSEKVRDAMEHGSEAAKADAGRLVGDEEREVGRVSKHVYKLYLGAIGGTKVCVLLPIILTLWQGFQISSDLWLSHWTGGKDIARKYDKDETEFNLVVYAALGGSIAFMVLARATFSTFLGLRAARHLFDSMTESLLRAPMKYFDANPIGRIVNRYGADVGTVDYSLPTYFGAFIATLFSTICQLAVAVYMVNFLGLLILPLVYIYAKIGNLYLAPSREISRLWKVSKSPVLSHVAQSEAGVVTIRAFGPEYVDRVIAENVDFIDVNNVMWFAETATNQWFGVRMQLVGSGVIIVIVSALVYLRDFLSPGLVGLVFTYALSIDSGLASIVQSWSTVEVLMVSPERVMEYTTIPPEGSQKPLTIEPPTQWPRQGTITFDNVVFSYKEGAPAVLKGLSFDIKNNEKIGIVGRTGAGKSSLTMALFRINELDAGRILIDGEDISTMPLRSLRSKLSIIPQSPVLFKGTLRAYMDPFDEFTDAEIWSAFEKVEMKEQIGSLENQLSYELSENGENFSVGERQMLCMARALLTQTRIVVMDEATASIDHATEKKLQTMIDRDFKDATVLTIAHRLATVLDSDRIMVLSDGNVVEFDSANNLVQNPKGVFYELAREGGYLDRLL